MTKEYQSREFCRDTACGYQIDLDYYKTPEDEKEFIKDEVCENCKAYEFHQWLKENGYKIVKGE